MCGRYVLAGDPERYADFFGARFATEERLDPSHNVAPTDPVYAVAEWEGERLLGLMTWGLIPHWADNPKKFAINARIETVARNPMFRESMAGRRCLIPADGFYEWEPRERGHTPHWIYRADGFPMAFAGLWSTWKDRQTGERRRTCAILTTDASGPVTGIHDRMPVLVESESWDLWLDRTLDDPAALLASIRLTDPSLIAEHAVSSRVNSVKNNDPELTTPV